MGDVLITLLSSVCAHVKEGHLQKGIYASQPAENAKRSFMSERHMYLRDKTAWTEFHIAYRC